VAPEPVAWGVELFRAEHMSGHAAWECFVRGVGAVVGRGGFVRGAVAGTWASGRLASQRVEELAQASAAEGSWPGSSTTAPRNSAI
jgi:hypothetical protein